MKGDFSHWKFDPTENFTGVLQQQGRVLLDRDWNEQTRIDSHRAEQTARDVIGRNVAAVPADEPDGFQVTKVVVGTGGDGKDRVELQVHTGRAWADGIPVVLSGDTDPVLRVADYFTPPVQSPGEVVVDITSGDRDAVILEVSHEAFNAFQDTARLIEPALGGPDTTVRIHTRAAFRLYRLGPNEDCHSIIPKLKDDPANRGQLTVRLQPTINVPGDCPVVAGGGYTGFEHFLYRIEIARLPDGEAPHFKWSQFNGGLVGRGQLQSTPNRITITANRPAIVNSGINEFYAEIVQRNDERGYWEVTMGATVTLSDGELQINTVRFGTFSASSDKVFFRLWNGIRAVSDFDQANPAELLDGIQLRFPLAAITNLMANDYWQFTVRAGEITNQDILFENAPPAGPNYHRVPLAEFAWVSPRVPVIPPELEDCRKPFRSLSNQKVCCTYHIGDGVHTFGDFNCLEEAAAHLPPWGGELCLMPGLHFCNVKFTDKQNIRIHGCRDRTWVFPKFKNPAMPIIHFEGGRNLSVEDVQLVSFAGACIYVEASDNGAPEGVCIQRSKMIALTNTIRVDEGEDIAVKENILHLWDTNFGGAVVSMRAEDVLVERNRIIVRPGGDLPETPGGGGDDGGDTPENPCLTPEDIYEQIETMPPLIVQIWLVAIFAAPAQPYRAQGGLHLRGGCSRVRVWENRISGGGAHGITLGGYLRYDALLEDDPDDVADPQTNPEITIGDEGGFAVAVQTVESGTDNAIADVPIFLTIGRTYAGKTDSNGFLTDKHPPGTYNIGASGYSIEKIEPTIVGDLKFPLHILHLAPAVADQKEAFLYDVEIDHNEISRMGLCGIGFSLLFGTEAAPTGRAIEAMLVSAGPTTNKAVLATTVFATLLSPRELVGTTNPLRGLRISQNSIFGNVLNPFTEPMRLAAQRVGLGGITLPIVDDLSITENDIRENGPTAVDPICGIFVGHGDNIAILDNEITGNGPVLDPQDYLDRRVQGLRSGIFICFAGSVAMAQGSRKPALRVQGNRVDQPAGRALTALAYGPVACDGNAFNSEYTGNWSIIDEAIGGVLLLNFGGLHRLFNQGKTAGSAIDPTTDGKIGGSLKAANFRLNAGGLRSRVIAETALPGGESLYNNNQLRLGPAHAGYTGQVVFSFDDVGYDANQSTLFGRNLLLANTIVLGPTVRATDSRFIEDLSPKDQPLAITLDARHPLLSRMRDLSPKDQPLAISLFTGGLGNITTHNQADHCIVAYPRPVLNSNLPTIDSPNQVRFFPDCDSLNEVSGLFQYIVLFLFAVQARGLSNVTDEQVVGEIGNIADLANVAGRRSIAELQGARADMYRAYSNESYLLEAQYGADDVRAAEVRKVADHQEKMLGALKVEREIADIAFKDRTAVTQPGLVAGPRGRIDRKGSGGIAGLEVRLVDRNGKPAGPVAKTDASGFYEFALPEDEAAALKERKDLFVEVRDAKGVELDKTAKPVRFDREEFANFTLAKPVISLDRSKVEKPIFERPVVAVDPTIPLEKIKGIGKVRAERLRESGIENIKTFLDTPADKLEEIIETKGTPIVEEARKAAEKIGARIKLNRPIRAPRKNQPRRKK